MNWFIFSILSVFLASIADLIQQKSFQAKDSLDDVASTFLVAFIQSILILPFIFLFNLTSEVRLVITSHVFWLLVLAALLSTLGTMTYFRSLRVKNISISIILGTFSVVVSTALGIIFFNESTDWFKFLGIFLILIAIVASQWQSSLFEKNHWFAVLAGLIFGILSVLSKDLLSSINSITFMFLIYFLGAMTAFILGPKKSLDSLSLVFSKSFWPYLIAASGYFLYNLFTFLAYTSGGEVGKVDAINNVQIFLIVLFEFFILKQTDSTFRKLITAVVAFTGMIVLGLT